MFQIFCQIIFHALKISFTLIFSEINYHFYFKRRSHVPRKCDKYCFYLTHFAHPIKFYTICPKDGDVAYVGVILKQSSIGPIKRILLQCSDETGKEDFYQIIKPDISESDMNIGQKSYYADKDEIKIWPKKWERNAREFLILGVFGAVTGVPQFWHRWHFVPNISSQGRTVLCWPLSEARGQRHSLSCNVFGHRQICPECRGGGMGWEEGKPPFAKNHWASTKSISHCCICQ